MRVETEQANTRRVVVENSRGIEENRREIQAVREDVRVILTKMEAREKHENRKLIIMGIIIGGCATLLLALISTFF